MAAPQRDFPLQTFWVHVKGPNHRVKEKESAKRFTDHSAKLEEEVAGGREGSGRRGAGEERGKRGISLQQERICRRRVTVARGFPLRCCEIFQKRSKPRAFSPGNGGGSPAPGTNGSVFQPAKLPFGSGLPLPASALSSENSLPGGAQSSPLPKGWRAPRMPLRQPGPVREGGREGGGVQP